ncbi:hypothetical protein QZH41_014529 [Actinostola sp. cb2023]|nr:hypothetical protein QZH41_014529 [Actinostola sp. cb2023]
MDVVPSAVLSPITELSMNLEHNSISMIKTPKRKLSLCNIGTPNTPNPSPCFLRTLSNESGYCASSPLGPCFDSPTMEVLKSSSTSGDRRKPFYLSRIGNLLLQFLKFSFLCFSKPLFKRWNSSPTAIDWQPSALSPSKLSDSQDSACDVDFDDECGDDGFIDDLVHEHDDKDHDKIGMPSGMAGLLSAPLVSKKSPEQSDSNCAVKNDTPRRPNPPRDPHPMEKKRLRQRCMSLVENNSMVPSPLLSNRVSFKHLSPLKRSNSEVFENRPDWSFLGHGIDMAQLIQTLHFQPYTLPTIKGQHQDLISITPDTVTRVINGEFNDSTEAHIIDCRYPFEYKGGHIKGALNIYRKEDLFEDFLKKPKHTDNNKKVIIIFHCEFSSKRGPDMSRFLRNRDRDIHGKDYPALYYPELYLLEGGYKAFFLSQKFYPFNKEHCEPQEYVLMLDDRHSEDLKLFSKRSKSWSGGHGKRSFCPGLKYR